MAPTLSYPGESDFPKSKEIGAGLIVAAAINPKLLAPLCQRFQTWQQAIEQDGIRASLATVVRLAVDGLWLTDLLGLWSLTGTLRQQVLDELIQLTRPTTPEADPPPAPRRPRAAKPRRSKRDPNQ